MKLNWPLRLTLIAIFILAVIAAYQRGLDGIPNTVNNHYITFSNCVVLRNTTITNGLFVRSPQIFIEDSSFYSGDWDWREDATNAFHEETEFWSTNAYWQRWDTNKHCWYYHKEDDK